MNKTMKRVVFIITLLVLIVFMIPFFVLVINTFKSTPNFIKNPFTLPKGLSLENYIIAIDRMNFWMAFRNTAIITVATIIVNMLLGSMAGYFFARKRWKINKIIFFVNCNNKLDTLR